MHSPLIRFGTSTWAYEGWYGLIYTQLYPPGEFKRRCLAEYARYEVRGERLFRTVGLDQTFYAPPTEAQLQEYAQQLPDDFDVCSKVWEEITIPRFPTHPRYGKKAGQPNPRFLDAALFLDEVLPPYSKAFKAYTGPFIFEFQRHGLAPEDFLPRLDRFLAQLPKDFEYGVEVRHPSLLDSYYRDVLQAHRVAHVYNHWTAMPPLMAQHERLTHTFTAPFTVCRLLTPLGVKYEDAVKMARPYNRLVRALPDMRAETVKLVRQAVDENRRSYVLVNNRSEGCAPLTVQALVDHITGSR